MRIGWKTLNLTKHFEDLLDTDVSGDTDISDDSSSEEERLGKGIWA